MKKNMTFFGCNNFSVFVKFLHFGDHTLHLVLIFSKDVYEIPVKLIISCLEPVELSVEVREEEKMWITKDQVVGREKSPSFESLEDFFLGFVLSAFYPSMLIQFSSILIHVF